MLSFRQKTKLSMPRDANRLKSIVVTFGPSVSELPWWWDEIQADRGLCPLSYKRLSFRNKRSKQLTTIEIFIFTIKMLPVFLDLRKKYDYMYTFECDLTTFALSFWQTLLFSRRPKHVVVQFIMREKTDNLGSRLKYIFMKWIFSSVHMATCSARAEAEYYRVAFNWPAEKTAFVPFHTSNRFIKHATIQDEGFIVSAGRIFRDYQTLVAAVQQSDYKTVIIAEKNTVHTGNNHNNIQVLENIPLSEYDKLMSNSRIVVVSLEDRKISAGQTVLLDAMALGKAVIATRTAATVDYIRDGENGLLVEPYNPQALREAIDLLMRDQALRQRLGAAARRDVIDRYLPHHYTLQTRLAVTFQNSPEIPV